MHSQQENSVSQRCEFRIQLSNLFIEQTTSNKTLMYDHDTLVLSRKRFFAQDGAHLPSATGRPPALHGGSIPPLQVHADAKGQAVLNQPDRIRPHP